MSFKECTILLKKLLFPRDFSDHTVHLRCDGLVPSCLAESNLSARGLTEWVILASL